ncbi:Uncharacterized protein TCM_018491 [Theobroma cacao]|uniref:Reverse transcriptase Ty1/copia-type domain-containing protein n=1 Tax=Theobroma cacao TaxID=3641 RepID=A0A061EGB0_THECC|nr:Uncharacterized protein TCM_018491 [Theobroma cacao]
MESTAVVFGEGHSIQRPPFFSGKHYAYWKKIMEMFIQSIDLDVWNVILDGLYVPTKEVDGKTIIKTRKEWDDKEKKVMNLLEETCQKGNIAKMTEYAMSVEKQDIPNMNVQTRRVLQRTSRKKPWWPLGAIVMTLKMKSIGTIGKNASSYIKNVLFVSGLKYNMLSISQLCDKGLRVIFESLMCHVVDIKTNETLFIGNRQGNTYVVFLDLSSNNEHYDDNVGILQEQVEGLNLNIEGSKVNEEVPQKEEQSIELIIEEGEASYPMVRIEVNESKIIGDPNQGVFCQKFAKIMQGKFEMSMMGELNYFLGLQIKQKEEVTFISQAKYTKDMFKRFSMDSSRTYHILMSTSIMLDKDEKVHLFIVPSLMASHPKCIKATANRTWTFTFAAFPFDQPPPPLVPHSDDYLFKYNFSYPSLE